MNAIHHTAAIEADADVPAIAFTRDFAATPAQVLRAHTDPELFARWVGPDDLTTEIDYWDARTGGSWRFVQRRHGANSTESFGFHGCFHEVSGTRVVQTFTWEGQPDGVSLDTLIFEDLGGGRSGCAAVPWSTASRCAMPSSPAGWSGGWPRATPSSTH